jgi:hypothetical protein
MTQLWQVTKLIRSKNAGPFKLTFDIIFKDQQSFNHVQKSGVLSADLFSRLYAVPFDEVQIFELPLILALKVSIPRPQFSGDLNDTDIYGGQFHSRLVRLSIGEEETCTQPTIAGGDSLPA